MWKLKIKEFMDDDRNSRQMSNKKEVNGIQVAKRHLLMTKREAFVMFTEANTEYSTFRKSIPKYVK